VYFLKNLVCSKPDCLYLHQYGRKEDVFTREDIMRITAIPPAEAILAYGQFSIEEPECVDACLPKIRLLSSKPRLQEEAVEVSSPLRRPKRKDSRYEFVEESSEVGMTVPTHIEEICELNSPGKETSNVSVRHIKQLLSPQSPERWMSDVVETDDTDMVIIQGIEDEDSTIGLKARANRLLR
jgi:hypothetical protein